MTIDITWDQSFRKILEQAGSSEPTPGGGSVTALIAALGGSMISMVSNLSLGKKYAHLEPQINEVIAKMKNLTTTCEELYHADITSFEKYMETLRLPKNSEEEKRIRNHALQEATISAVEVPLRLIEVCKEGILCAHRIAEICNKHVISDLGIGALLFHAAAHSSSLTVEINLASLSNMELKERYADKLAIIMSDINELKSKTLYITRERIME